MVSIRVLQNIRHPYKQNPKRDPNLEIGSWGSRSRDFDHLSRRDLWSAQHEDTLGFKGLGVEGSGFRG